MKKTLAELAAFFLFYLSFQLDGMTQQTITGKTNLF
jgi:hypothetical protein